MSVGFKAEQCEKRKGQILYAYLFRPARFESMMLDASMAVGSLMRCTG
jgi:hypothetical protein